MQKFLWVISLWFSVVCVDGFCMDDAHFVQTVSADNSFIYEVGNSAYKAQQLSLWLGASPLDPSWYEKGDISKVFRFEKKVVPITKRTGFPFLVVGIFTSIAVGTGGLIAARKRR